MASGPKPARASYYALLGVKVMTKVRKTGLDNPFSFTFCSKSFDGLLYELKRDKPHDRADQQVDEALRARCLQ